MSKKCIVCDNICKDSDQACPVCGSYELITVFASAPTSQQTTPVQQQVPPIQQTTPVQQVPPVQQVTPVQQVPPVQQVTPVQQVPPVSQAAPVQQVPPVQQQAPYSQQPYMGQTTYQQQAPIQGQPVYYNMPYPSDQMPVDTVPPKKKSHKALFIILGSIGGVMVIGIIIAVILLGRYIQNPNQPSVAQGGHSGRNTYTTHDRVETNDREYYFPDYRSADHSSESYVTNHPATESSAEPDQTSSFNDNTTEESVIEEGAAAFTDQDLIIFSSANNIQIPIEEDYSYQVLNTELCRINSYDNEYSEDLDNAKGYGAFKTGRGTGIGSAVEDYLEKYGTDTTNALWIMLNGSYSTTYYYSAISKPNFADEHSLLTIGWSIDGTSFHRLTPEELNDIIFNYDTTGSNIRYLIYYADIDADYTIRSLSMVYGNPMVIPELDE